MVFCRNSTLLCRQLVRRSMVFSTVQISMPGTSCAWLPVDISMQGVKTTDATQAMRPNMKILNPKSARHGQFVASEGQGRHDITLKPQSRVEVLRSRPQLRLRDRIQGRGTQGACARLS